MINRSTSILVIIIASFLFSSCNKDDPTVVSGIPYVTVEEMINLNNPAYFDLGVPGGWVYYPAGSRGLIIYRKNQDTFVAMDRHCPYKPEDGCRVDVDNSEVFSEDACCGSQFGISDAAILQGPAVVNLRIYNTTYDGTFLRVFN